MRADERQAAIAYTYAWWLTGEDQAAAAALRHAILAPAPRRGEDVVVTLARHVRDHLSDVHTMPPSSEMTLLHDGLELDLDAAADLAGVADDDIPAGLAHGRLEALLETVREDFEHPERLGGLAVGEPADMDHARQCPSCARARTLIERGRTELREVVSVSAPAGLLTRLVAEAAAQAPAEVEVAEELADLSAPEAPAEIEDPTDTPIAAPDVVDAPADIDAPAEVDVPPDIDGPADIDITDGGEAADIDAPHADADITLDEREKTEPGPAVAVPGTAPDTEPETEPDTEIVLDEPTAGSTIDLDLDDLPPADARTDVSDADVEELPPLEEGEGVEQDDVIDLTEERPSSRLVATTPAKKRTAGAMVGVGFLAVCLLVAFFFTPSMRQSAEPTSDPETENPAVGGEEPTERPTSGRNGDGPSQGPPGRAPRDFRVVQIGLLLPGEDAPAASGAEVGPDDLIRIAVDYEGATEGVRLTAIWRVDEERFDRLRTLVSSKSSRHVWGVTPPEGGWPAGAHRIVLTADDGVAGAVDFTVTD